MTSRSDCEPLPKPTLSALLHAGTFLCVSVFHCRRVVCVPLPALRVPLVHIL